MINDVIDFAPHSYKYYHNGGDPNFSQIISNFKLNKIHIIDLLSIWVTFLVL